MMSSEVTADTDDLLVQTAEENTSDSSSPGWWSRCWRRRWSLFFVEPVLIAYCIGVFPVMILTQKYALEWITIHIFNSNSTGAESISSPCDPNITDSERRLNDKVQSVKLLFVVVQTVVYGVPALVVTVLLGAGSDRFGRRFAMMPPLVGVLFNIALSYVVVRTRSSIAYFFIGSFVFGCCGSHTAMLMACLAYVSDRAPANRRMFRITVLQLCMLVTVIAAPVALTPLVDAIGLDNVVLILFFVAVINFTYVFVCLRYGYHKVDREPIKADDQADVPGQPCTDNDGGSGLVDAGASRLQSATDFDAPRSASHRQPPHSETRSDDDLLDLNVDSPQPRSELAEPRVGPRTLCDGFQQVALLFLVPGRSRARLNLLMATFFVSTLPSFDSQLLILFEMNKPLCWTSEIATFSMSKIIVSALGAGILTPLMKKFVTDWHIAMTAAIAAVITEVYLFFVRSTLMMYLSLTLSMFVVLVVPSIRSLMSALVSDHEQGTLFGAIASVEVVCMMLGTFIFDAIYGATLGSNSGFVFLVMAVFYVVSCALLVVYHMTYKLEARRHQPLQHDATEPI